MSNKHESLRNEIDYELHYVGNDGKAGIKKLHITFVSQSIYQAYSEIIQEAYEAVDLNKKMEDTTREIGYQLGKINATKGKGAKTPKEVSVEAKAKMLEAKDAYEHAVARLNEISAHSFEKKFNVIQKLLNKNGIQDKDMQDIDWWKDCVEMTDVMDFIVAACSKDDVMANNKKKA